ncbi:MAG: hypothetical protein U0U46_03885 [Saprospiraceae bacterium]
MENSLSPGSSGSTGSFCVRNVVKNLVNAPGGGKQAQISWKAPADGLGADRYEVGLYRRESAASVYELIAYSQVTSLETYLYDSQLGASGPGNYPRYALKINAKRGAVLSYIVIEDIIKFES